MISLAYSVKKMLYDQNFVKRLESCEKIGLVNTICLDKETITTNRMVLSNIYIQKDLKVKVHAQRLDLKDYFINDRIKDLYVTSICCSTVGSIREASSLEEAMLSMMVKSGVDY